MKATVALLLVAASIAAPAQLPPGVTTAMDMKALPLPDSGHQIYFLGELHGIKETAAVVAAWLEKLAAAGLRDVAIEEKSVYEAEAQAYVEGTSDHFPEALCLRANFLDIVRRFNQGRAPDFVRIHLVDVDSPAPAIRAHLLAISKRLGAPSGIKLDGAEGVEQLKHLTADTHILGELRTIEHSFGALRQGFEVDTKEGKGSPYLEDREAAIAANLLDLLHDRSVHGVLAIYGNDHISKARRKDGGPGRNQDFAPTALRLEGAGVNVFSLLTVPLSGRWSWRGRGSDTFWTAEDASLADGRTLDRFLIEQGRPAFLYVDQPRQRIRFPGEDLNKFIVDASVLMAAGTPMENRCAANQASGPGCFR